MKVAITGHTGAIGSEICKLLGDVKGFSRSNGYDIRTDRDQILMESQECDVFINLANSEYASTDLLIELFDEWKDEKKQIINIGSAVADYYDMRLDLARYAAQKAALKQVSKMLNHQKTQCEVRYLSFGYIDTPKMKKKYPEAKDIMSTEEAARIICSIISNI
jgi:NAD(P)-dependent dehydrogenase (short-subunit alcohol dehydrogenase family)